MNGALAMVAMACVACAAPKAPPPAPVIESTAPVPKTKPPLYRRLDPPRGVSAWNFGAVVAQSLPAGADVYVKAAPGALAAAVAWANEQGFPLELDCHQPVPRDLQRVLCTAATGDDDLAQLPAGLIALDLTRAPLITEAGIAHLDALPDLRELRVEDLDETAVARIGRLTRLETLDLGWTYVDKELALGALTNLRSLTMRGGDRDAVLHVTHLPALQALVLRDAKLDANEAAALAAMRSLRVLALHRASFDGPVLAALARSRTLASLDLTEATGVGDDDLAALSSLASLHSLSLGFFDISDAGVAHLAKLTSLRWLALDGPHLSDAGVAALEALPELEWLSLHSVVELHDAALISIARLPALRFLSIMGDFDSDGIRALGTAHALETMWIQGIRPRVSLAPLAGAVSLETLDISQTHVGDDELAPALSLPHLQQLAIGNTRVTGTAFARVTPAQLRALDADNATFTPAGFAALERLSGLEVLSLHDARGVGDAQLVSVAKLASLRALDLRGTDVTDAGMPLLARLGALRALAVEYSVTKAPPTELTTPAVAQLVNNGAYSPVQWCPPRSWDTCRLF